MELRVIRYNDPEGRQLDLIRVVRRTIHNNMPEDYDGLTVPDVKQDVTFTREKIINDDGESHFTEWHCDDPFWSEYIPEEITGYQPDVSLIKSKKLDENSTNEEENVNYIEKKETEKPKEETIKPIERGKKERKSFEQTKKTQVSEVNDQAKRRPHMASKKKPKDNNVQMVKEKTKIAYDKETGEILSKPVKKAKIKETITAKPLEFFHAPRHVEMVELDPPFLHLISEEMVKETLEHLKIIGYFYFENNQWNSKEFLDANTLAIQ